MINVYVNGIQGYSHEVLICRQVFTKKGGVSKSMLTLNETIIDVKKG